MHVLLTRPDADAEPLKSRIELLGHRVSLAPLLSIALEPIAADAFANASAIVATSRNGLRALAASPSLSAVTKLPVFAIGPATSAYARDLGFADVVSGPGTAADLVPVIAAHPAAKTGSIVHLAGDHLAFDSAGALARLGVRVTTLPAYRSVAAQTFEPGIVASFKSKAFDAVVLMSPRTAATWAGLVKASAGDAPLTTITHICMSEAVASALTHNLPQTCPHPKVEVAAKPNAEEILALLSRLAAQSFPE